MNNTNTGGPAFPTPLQHNDWREDYPGMTLRDYFAAKAMQGIMSDPNYLSCGPDKVVELAYEQADAMLRAREA